VHVLIVEPLGMPTSHPHQAGNGLFSDLHEPGCGPDTTAFTEMVDDILRSGLWELGIEQGGATSFGERLPTGATAQQADTIMAIQLPNNEVVSPSMAKQLAFGIDAR
jgi:hypothetical protein